MLRFVFASTKDRRPSGPAAAVLVLAAIWGLIACAPEPAPPSESLAEALDDTALEHAAKHLDSRYVCPMHPQIVRDEPGTCPICGMDLVEKRIEAGPKLSLIHI